MKNESKFYHEIKKNINQQEPDKDLKKKEVSTPLENKEILKPVKKAKKAVQKKEVPKKISFLTLFCSFLVVLGVKTLKNTRV